MALEGGRQSGHLEQQANTEILKDYGFFQFRGEACIFTFKRDNSFLLVIACIDDLAIAYVNKHKKLFDHFAKAYGNHFKSKISNQVDKFTRPQRTHGHTIAGALHREDGCPLPAEQDDGRPTTTPASSPRGSGDRVARGAKVPGRWAVC
eukprot:2967824-Pleurochrysis_carterae.AAC.1